MLVRLPTPFAKGTELVSCRDRNVPSPILRTGSDSSGKDADPLAVDLRGWQLSSSYKNVFMKRVSD